MKLSDEFYLQKPDCFDPKYLDLNGYAYGFSNFKYEDTLGEISEFLEGYKLPEHVFNDGSLSNFKIRIINSRIYIQNDNQSILCSKVFKNESGYHCWVWLIPNGNRIDFNSDFTNRGLTNETDPLGPLGKFRLHGGQEFYDDILKTLNQYPEVQKDYLNKYNKSFEFCDWEQWRSMPGIFNLIAKANLSLDDKFDHILSIGTFNLIHLFIFKHFEKVFIDSDSILKLVPKKRELIKIFNCGGKPQCEFELSSASKSIITYRDVLNQLLNNLYPDGEYTDYLGIEEFLKELHLIIGVQDILSTLCSIDSYYNFIFNNVINYDKRLSTIKRKYSQKINAKLKEIENEVRIIKGYPTLGEFINESILYRKIKENYPELEIISQGRPFWLGNQSFDIYIPEYNIAIEYQGDQHFRSIDFFGGEEAFTRNVDRDRRKKLLSEQNNCRLLCVMPNYIFNDVIKEIDEHIEMK